MREWDEIVEEILRIASHTGLFAMEHGFAILTLTAPEYFNLCALITVPFIVCHVYKHRGTIRKCLCVIRTHSRMCAQLPTTRGLV